MLVGLREAVARSLARDEGQAAHRLHAAGGFAALPLPVGIVAFAGFAGLPSAGHSKHDGGLRGFGGAAPVRSPFCRVPRLRNAAATAPYFSTRIV